MSSATATTVESLREWIVKRGILYFLVQTPMLALFLGYFLRWTDFPTATAFTVILAFVLLPIWVLMRKNASDDPDEPVHHLHKYALYALVPYVVYNLARIPAHYVLNIVFWDHWYDFGSELTGQPVDQYSSLVPGTFIHSLQGYVLALGFYILYKRHTLTNALIYVWLFLSTIYTWTFPSFVLVDFQPPPKWFFVVWWAHLWMAIAAWAVPRTLYSSGFWNRFKSTSAKATAIVLILFLYFLPVTFVFWRVATWQFPLQNTIDQRTFEAVELVLSRNPTLNMVGFSSGQEVAEEASYEFALRFGPRPYIDYINATKALDAGPVRVTGRLTAGEEIIAFCTGYVAKLETPNNILVPGQYFPTLRRMEFTDIPVQCFGGASVVEGIIENAAPVDVYWTAEITLIGDRGRMERTFSGTASAIPLE